MNLVAAICSKGCSRRRTCGHLWKQCVKLQFVPINLHGWTSLAPDLVRTLFFWGFANDERLAERLTFHKRNGKSPLEVLPLPVALYETFSKAEFEEAIRIPGQKIDFKVAPGGREITGEMPEGLDLCAQKLTNGLLPLTNSYPMPFYRIRGV